jgi:hypothetical protein
VLLGVAGLLDAINVVGNRAASLTCLFHISFPWCPDIKPIKTALVGKYQVVLGPGGGCNGGPPNSNPGPLASIDNKNGSLIATNECGKTSPLNVVDSHHGFWWGQPIDFIVNEGSITITEHRSGPNSWVKIE